MLKEKNENWGKGKGEEGEKKERREMMNSSREKLLKGRKENSSLERLEKRKEELEQIKKKVSSNLSSLKSQILKKKFKPVL